MSNLEIKKKKVSINEEKNIVNFIPKEGKGNPIPKKNCKSCGPIYQKPHKPQELRTNTVQKIHKVKNNQTKNYSLTNHRYYSPFNMKMVFR